MIPLLSRPLFHFSMWRTNPLRCLSIVLATISILGIDRRHAIADVSLRAETLALINKFRAGVHAPLSKTRLVEADLSTVGCPQDGQVGPKDAPILPKRIRIIVPEGSASSLTY